MNYTDIERELRSKIGPPTHEEFRKSGFTGAAAQYPRTEEDFLDLCRFNGIRPDQAPRTFYYAPNPYMLEHGIELRNKYPKEPKDPKDPKPKP